MMSWFSRARYLCDVRAFESGIAVRLFSSVEESNLCSFGISACFVPTIRLWFWPLAGESGSNFLDSFSARMSPLLWFGFARALCVWQDFPCLINVPRWCVVFVRDC